MDALVTTDWLDGERSAKDLRIVDASWFLPEHGRDAAAEFSAAHIPGAVFLDLASVSDQTSTLPSMLPTAAQFAERVGALGIGADDRIVLYDNSPLHSAARAWWMFRLFGARHVAILDGGLALWSAEGRDLADDDSTPQPAHFHAREDRSGVRDLESVRTTTDQLVDARSPARFAGEEPEERAGVTPGHIPGSANVHYATLFHSDGSWKQGNELREAFAGKGIDIDRPILTTCGSGITAAVLVFGLHLLGKEAALYDGSWTQWGAHPDTPKATGRA